MTIETKWEENKEMAQEFGVTEDEYTKYENVRNYLNNISQLTLNIEMKSNLLTPLINFRDSFRFKIEHAAVQEAINTKIDKIEKEVELSKLDIEKHKEWIKEYLV